MSTHTPKRRSPGCLVFLLVIAALVVYSGFRYYADRPVYIAAHVEYLKGNCASTLSSFERLSAAFRPLDFGRLGELSQAEELDCKAYLAAGMRGIAGYFEYATNPSPSSPLAKFARKFAMDEIGQIAGSTAHLEEICPLKESLVQEGWISHPDETLPRFDYVCGSFYLGMGNTEAALNMMLDTLDRYPLSAFASWTIQEIWTRQEICYALDKIVLYPVIMNHVELYPEQLLKCGAYFVEIKDYTRAVAALDSFLVNYPLRPEIMEAKRLDAVALVGLSETMPTRWIRAPDPSVYGKEELTQLVLQNDSPNKIRVVLVGPEVVLVEMDPCGVCSDFHKFGPVWCPGKGPKETFELLPGLYKVLIEPLDERGIGPSVGKWVLGERNTFYTCYFVVN